MRVILDNCLHASMFRITASSSPLRCLCPSCSHRIESNRIRQSVGRSLSLSRARSVKRRVDPHLIIHDVAFVHSPSSPPTRVDTPPTRSSSSPSPSPLPTIGRRRHLERIASILHPSLAPCVSTSSAPCPSRLVVSRTLSMDCNPYGNPPDIVSRRRLPSSSSRSFSRRALAVVAVIRRAIGRRSRERGDRPVCRPCALDCRCGFFVRLDAYCSRMGCLFDVFLSPLNRLA